MMEALIARYDRPVPRYTSYPTAPHFHAEIGPEAYASWLAALPPEERVSLYLHVPFCASMCWYCGCHTKVVARHEPVAEYAERLRREVALVADRIGRRQPVGHIHWGGGTPNMLSAGEFAGLMETIRARFAVAEDAEIAAELDPRTLDPETIRALGASGVNRASIGVQDFDARVQRAVNRIQPFDVVAAAVAHLRAAGVSGINFDLIYGLPHQTEESVARTIDLAVSLAPDRLALFGYAHVPWMKTHQRLINEAELPDGPARWRLYEAASRRITGHGYVAIGLDHFARPTDAAAVALREGKLARNFQGYTTDACATLIGLGASSIGSFAEGYVQNATDLREWAQAIDAGHLATRRGVALAVEDRLRRDVIMRLMCDLEVDLDAAALRYGAGGSCFASEREALRGLAEDGLVEIRGGLVTVTERGRPLVRTVAAVFDTYLPQAKARHSRAV